MNLSKKNSIIAICILAVIMSSAMIACKSKDAENQTEVTAQIPDFEPLNDVVEGRPDVYLIVKLLDSDYWKVIINGARDSGNQNGVNVYYSGTSIETDWQGQSRLLDKALEQGADGIILAPNDSVKLSDQLRDIRSKGIPVALVDTVVNDDVFDICYMTDNYIAGQNAAEDMLMQLKSKGHDKNTSLSVGILVGNSNSQTISERLAGFYQYWSENAPRKWIISSDIKNCNGDLEVAATMAQELLSANPNMAGMYGTNNGPTKVLCNTVMGSGRKDVVVVGFDYSDEMKAMIASEEYVASTMLQCQYDMGFDAVASVKSLTEGGVIKNKFEDTGVVTAKYETMQTLDVMSILKTYEVE